MTILPIAIILIVGFLTLFAIGGIWLITETNNILPAVVFTILWGILAVGMVSTIPKYMDLKAKNCLLERFVNC